MVADDAGEVLDEEVGVLTATGVGPEEYTVDQSGDYLVVVVQTHRDTLLKGVHSVALLVEALDQCLVLLPVPPDVLYDGSVGLLLTLSAYSIS